MESEASGPQPRTPLESDLIQLCRELNVQGARYIVVGGFAVMNQGFVRATEDIDLLIEGSVENQERVKRALEILPDKAVRELGADDLRDYVVVRVADEIMVDLMLFACGISYEESVPEIEWREAEGVRIPFASARLLLRMKQTYRDKDALDRQFLAQEIERKRTPPPQR